MVDLNEVALFVKVVDTGSFTAAARLLGLPKTTVSRKIAHLEEALGTRLLHRTTRSLSPTEAGRQYYGECSAGLAAFEEANRRIAGAQQVPSGTVRISAPADTANYFVSDIVGEFLAAHDRVRVELVLTDERLDLVRERIDVAFRMGQLADSALVARKLGSGSRILCASPAYLAVAGTPKVPTDLKAHACIVHGASVDGVSWTLRGPRGRSVVPVSARLAVNSMAFALKAAVAGLGVAMLPKPMAASDLRFGRLRTVLEDYELPATGIHLVYPSRRHLSAATKALIDFAAKRVPEEKRGR
jgi:DNA-binding transcriptional LysR family regulator